MRTSARSGELVGTSFPDNPFAPRINVPNSDLASFGSKALVTLGKLTVVVAVEYLLYYLQELEEFRAHLIPEDAETPKHDQPEEQFAQNLIRRGCSAPKPLIRTITYLRLRRNHIAHANDSPHQSLRTVVKDHAHQIAKFWNGQPTKLPGLSFSSMQFSEVDEAQAFSLVNLCRVIAEEIDPIFCRTIPEQVMERYAAANFAGNNRSLKGRTSRDRQRKFIAHFRNQYGGISTLGSAELDTLFGHPDLLRATPGATEL